MKKLHSSLLAFASLAAVSVAAETTAPTNDITRLPAVVVTAARLPDETMALEKFPANVTVITATDIKASPAANIPDLLSQEVGLTPLDTVGGGAFANLSMRGFGEKSGTLVLVNGTRVNDAGESSLPFLWNSVPLDNIERIEIIRGGASTTYGEGAVGGVINIITKKPSAKLFEPTIGGAGGNLGYNSEHLDVSGSTNQFSYFVSADRQEWDGWRDGSAYRNWSVQARPSIETPLGRFTFGYHFFDEHSENPDKLTEAQFQANPRQRGATQFVFENTRHRYTLDYSKELADDWTLLAQMNGQTYDTFSSGYALVNTEQPNYGGTFQMTHKSEWFGRENALTFGGEAGAQDFQQDVSSIFGPSSTTVDYWNVGGFVQDRLQLTKRLALTAGTRFDYRDWRVRAFSAGFYDINASRKADVWSPKATLDFELAEKTTAWLSFSRAYRLPSGNDISAVNFDVSGPVLFFPNPDIRPIDARTVELGVRSTRCDLLSGSLALFYSQVRDDIVFDPATFQNANFDSLKRGVELSLNSQPCKYAGFFFNAAYTDSIFDGGAYDGNRLPLVPEWQLSGGVNLTLARGLTWRWEVVHVRGQALINDLSNNLPRNDYTVLNTRLNYQWKNVNAYAAINNLTDALYEQFPASSGGVVYHNPAAGINFRIGLTMTF